MAEPLTCPKCLCRMRRVYASVGAGAAGIWFCPICQIREWRDK